LPVFGPRFQPGTCWLWSRDAIQYTETLDKCMQDHDFIAQPLSNDLSRSLLYQRIFIFRLGCMWIELTLSTRLKGAKS
jgi:hypothetical protein